MTRENIKKQFVKNVGSGMIAQVVFFVVGMILLPYVMRHLGVEAYGVYELAASAIAFFNILQLGIAPGLMRFYSQAIAANDREAIRKISGAAQLALGGLGLIGSISIIVMIPFFMDFYNIPEVLRHDTVGLIICMSISFVTNMIFIVPNSLIIGNNRCDVSNGIEIAANLWRLVSVICTFELVGPTILVLGVCLLSAQIFRLIAFLAFAIKFTGHRAIISRKSIDLVTLRSLAGFSLLMFVNTIAFFMVMQCPSLIVGKTMGVKYVTLLAPAKLLGNAIASFITKASNPLVPIASQFKENKECARLGRWAISVATIIFLIGLGILLPLVIYGEKIVGLWLSSEFGSAWTIIVIFALGAVVSQVASVLHYLALGGGGMKPVVFSQVVVGVVISIGIAVGTTYGGWSLISVASYVLACRVIRNMFYLTIAYSKQLNYNILQFFRQVYLEPLILFSVVALLGMLMRYFWLFESTISLVAGVLMVFCMYTALAFLISPATAKFLKAIPRQITSGR